MLGKRTLFVFMGVLSLSAAINPDNICVLVPDGTKIVDDTNCAGYYTCKGGKATAATCSSGYFFDKDSKACVLPSLASCISSQDAPCKGVADDKFVPMAGSCSGYYYCKNQLATAGECPDKLNFNPTEQRCMYKTEYTCTIAGGSGSSDVTNDDPEVLCAYVPKDMFFGNAASCTTWHKCKDTGLISGACKGYVFDVKIQECVDAAGYDCNQLNGDSTQTGGAPLGACPTTERKLCDEDKPLECYTVNDVEDDSGCKNIVKGLAEFKVCPKEPAVGGGTRGTGDTAGTGGIEETKCPEVCKEDTTTCWSICKVDGKPTCSKVCELDANGPVSTTCTIDCEEIKKYKDPESCSTYMTCSNKKLMRSKCPLNQYFSVPDQECTSRENAVNKCDRCQGTSLTFVNAYNDDCKGYFYCSNGKKAGEGVCPDKYWFDENSGSCVGKEISYKACLKLKYNDDYDLYA